MQTFIIFNLVGNLMRIDSKKDIEKITEGLELELYLIDDLLEEIHFENSLDRIDEGILDFLKKFNQIGWNILKGGAIDVFMGKYSQGFSGSMSRLFKSAGKRAGAQLDPDKNKDDLLIWAGSQDFVLACVVSIEGLISMTRSLPSPIPDPTNKNEISKWSNGGEYEKITGEISRNYVANAISAARIISDSSPKVKKFKPVLNEMINMAKDKPGGVIGGLKSIQRFCDEISSGSWAKAMKKAKKIAKKKGWFKDNGHKLKALEAIEIAKTASQKLRGEISRLDGEEKKIKFQTARSKGAMSTLKHVGAGFGKTIVKTGAIGAYQKSQLKKSQ